MGVFKRRKEEKEVIKDKKAEAVAELQKKMDELNGKVAALPEPPAPPEQYAAPKQEGATVGDLNRFEVEQLARLDKIIELLEKLGE